MADWKAVERTIADRLGGRRVPITGRTRGETPDVSHDYLSLEVKTRKTLPAWFMDAMAQAKAANKDGRRLPAVVLHEHGDRYDNAFIGFRLADFLAWFGQPEGDGE